MICFDLSLRAWSVLLAEVPGVNTQDWSGDMYIGGNLVLIQSDNTSLGHDRENRFRLYHEGEVKCLNFIACHGYRHELIGLKVETRIWTASQSDPHKCHCK